MKPEKHFKHIKKFWFQDRDGYRHIAKVCCVVGSEPADVNATLFTTTINGGCPVQSIIYKCNKCGKDLEVES